VTHKRSRILWTAAIILTALPLAQAQVFTIVAIFGGNSGGVGSAPLARDAVGNLYGAGFDAVFKIDPTGKITTLYTFKGAPDGYGAVQVVLDPDGNLYGTTQYGGTGTCSNGAYPGCGTVFKLAATGEETILHSFTGSPDGSWPNGLIRDAKGNLYGTTYLGGSGAGTCFGTGCGTVYKIDPAGKETVLFRFDDGADGGLPLANLLLADGALYSTTAAGGTGPCKNSYNSIVGCGTIFKLVGRKETVLHNFQGFDGSWPESNVVRDSAGNLYATALQGGLFTTYDCDFGCGAVVKLEPSGKETILHFFEDQNDGESPTGMVIDSKDNLFGSAGGLGTVAGTVFEIDAKGQFTILHAFEGQGAGEPGDLILDDQGNLYGSGSWMIFRITP
jgi:uncharacterized repeat protein (TIGR03803 family)